MRANSDSGFTLIETMIAMFVLTVGVIGMASVFLYGMQNATSAPNELVATQKAAEAIESVFAARDSRTKTWAQMQNVSYAGIFIDGPTAMKVAGADGILNTSDDGAVESVALPGPDGTFGTADDTTQALTGMTRQIAIVELTPLLREITVTITYQGNGGVQRSVLTALISQFA